ncbi:MULTISPECIES: hypothetical protein [Flavobacterium]|uniref:hypothetical protein n=1 Tax=Flavobacterium TaxID=237 RepID=UPI001FCC8C7D|nr:MULTISPECIES: hypothetical protein [Flavobacterium]UOK41540.1 hypothetical protein LZF87_09455 [Flavobacterium enshiense]
MRIVAGLSLVLLSLSCSNDGADSYENKFKGELAWTKSYGGSLEDRITSVVETPDGGSLVLGFTNSSDGNIVKSNALMDIWLAKLDAEGNLVWTKTIGGSQDDFGTSIIATNDGNYVIAGYTGSNDGDIPGNIGFHDFLITKITGEGNIIWSKNYGFVSHDHAHKVIQLKDGGFFIAGYADYAGIEGTPGDGNHGEGHSFRQNQNVAKHGVGEYFGIRLDANGDFKWYRYFGGRQNDRINDIAEANDGGIVLAGYSESTDYDIDNNKGSYDYWILKLDSNGHLHWKKNFGGSGIDQAFSIVKTDNNSYLVAGRSNSEDGDVSNPKGDSDAWVIHINDHGELLWDKSFGTSDFDVATSIKKLKNGKFGVVGNTRGNVENNSGNGENDFWYFEIDIHPNSPIHFQKTLGGSGIDIATDFIQTKNDEILLVGESQSNNLDVLENKGGNDLWMVKLK